MKSLLYEPQLLSLFYAQLTCSLVRPHLLLSPPDHLLSHLLSDPPAGYPSLRKAVSPLSAGELPPAPPLLALALAHPSQPGLPAFPE